MENLFGPKARPGRAPLRPQAPFPAEGLRALLNSLLAVEHVHCIQLDAGGTH